MSLDFMTAAPIVPPSPDTFEPMRNPDGSVRHEVRRFLAHQVQVIYVSTTGDKCSLRPTFEQRRANVMVFAPGVCHLSVVRVSFDQPDYRSADNMWAEVEFIVYDPATIPPPEKWLTFEQACTEHNVTP